MPKQFAAATAADTSVNAATFANATNSIVAPLKARAAGAFVKPHLSGGAT
jgi:hypothetical protein